MKSLDGQTLNKGTTMTLNEVAVALSGNINGKWINVRGPGHTSGDRSLGIRFDPDAPNEFSLKSFASDDLTTCRAYVKKLLQKLSAGGPLAVEHLAEASKDTAAQRCAASMKVWNEAVPARGTVVEKYLATRGCLLAAAFSNSDVLRFNPHCPFGADRAPAMVALMTDVITGEPRGIHRTALMDDGSGKRVMPDGISAKRMLGSPKGAVVRLAPAAEIMGVAEGIETALTAQELFKVPTWAALSASGVAAFPVLPGLRRLTIFADNDPTGIDAAYRCAHRYSGASVDVQVRYPCDSGTDWNDFVSAGAAK